MSFDNTSFTRFLQDFGYQGCHPEGLYRRFKKSNQRHYWSNVTLENITDAFLEYHVKPLQREREYMDRYYGNKCNCRCNCRK